MIAKNPTEKDFSISKLRRLYNSASSQPTWVYPFTGLDYWTGTLDWTTGLGSYTFQGHIFGFTRSKFFYIES